VVQVDPLSVIARNHDIALYERVIDYRPADLDNFLYTQRKGFDWGGVVMIHAMTELPYLRALMARRIKQPRFAKFLAEHPAVIDTVYETIRERGPLSNRDFPAPKTIISIHFRSPKDTGLALYYLWMAGELMTHSRKGVERIYDLRERIAPPEFDYVASPDDADNFFMPKVFHELGIVSPRSFRNGLYGIVERKVAPSEAAERLAALLTAGKIVEIRLDADKKTPHYILSENLPHLEALIAGHIPDAWQPIETSTAQEVTFLSPLEIVSARGRAQKLFDFEYLWEVYKPLEKRRWGYYTMPILYGDQLVARFDPKLERATNTLIIKGFWLETNTIVDQPFAAALKSGLQRFMAFVGATKLELQGNIPSEIAATLQT
ncbi:MAG: winged helix-turn-helix domain-containing protein, partial [Anaerolineae bacterium]|nr:winged helix-turn-helix domain-containing protein [Anaerolineae bacterium]